MNKGSPTGPKTDPLRTLYNKLPNAPPVKNGQDEEQQGEQITVKKVPVKYTLGPLICMIYIVLYLYFTATPMSRALIKCAKENEGKTKKEQEECISGFALWGIFLFWTSHMIHSNFTITWGVK